MFKIDSINAANSLPTPQPIGPNPNGFFSYGDSSGTSQNDLPTRVDHDLLNAIQEEICYVITHNGLTLDKDDRTQLYQAINIQASGVGPSPGVLAEVEDDPSPTLGGDLKVNSKKIKATAGDIVLEASTGDIDLNAIIILIDSEIQHLLDTNNKIVFGTATQTMYANGLNIFDISASGLRMGGSGARVTTVDNDTTMAADSPTRLATQHAIKTYFESTGILPTPEEYYYYIRGNISTVTGTLEINVVNPFALSAGDYEIDIYSKFWTQNASTYGGANYRYNRLQIQGCDDGATANLVNCGNVQANEGMYNTVTDASSPSWLTFKGSNGTTPLITRLFFESVNPTAPGDFLIRLHFRRVA